MGEKEKNRLFRQSIQESVIHAIQTKVDLRESVLVNSPEKVNVEMNLRIKQAEGRMKRDTTDIGPIL